MEELQKSICNEPVLRIPIPGAPFRIEADSSDFANGAVLSQLIDNKWHLVAYCSESLTLTERNYPIYDKELLVIMSSLKEWRHYILGYPLPIQVYTDHQNILYWTEPRNLNRRQARWMIELQEYDLEIYYQKGKLNTKADLLSRRADHDRGEKDNQEVILVKWEWL